MALRGRPKKITEDNINDTLICPVCGKRFLPNDDSKYFSKPNVIENRYFVVRVEHSLINVVNRSNNWDEIRFSYEQLISDKGK